MPGISKGILFNAGQALLKEWGLDCLLVLPEDTMQELLTGVTFNFSIPNTYIHHFSYLSLPVLLY